MRDMLDAYRIQAQAGPVTDKTLEEIIFRAAHGVLQSLAPYPCEQRVALLPSVVRILLATFLEDGGGTKWQVTQVASPRIGTSREWPKYRHRLQHLIMAGWKPMKPMLIVNWCGHSQQFYRSWGRDRRASRHADRVRHARWAGSCCQSESGPLQAEFADHRLR